MHSPPKLVNNSSELHSTLVPSSVIFLSLLGGFGNFRSDIKNNDNIANIVFFLDVEVYYEQLKIV